MKRLLVVVALVVLVAPAFAGQRTDELLYGLNYADVKGVGKLGQGSIESSWPVGSALRFGVRGSMIYSNPEVGESSDGWTGGGLAGFDVGQMFVEATGDYFVNKLDDSVFPSPNYMYGIGVGLKPGGGKSLVKIRLGADRFEGSLETYDRVTFGVAIGRRP